MSLAGWKEWLSSFTVVTIIDYTTRYFRVIVNLSWEVSLVLCRPFQKLLSSLRCQSASELQNNTWLDFWPKLFLGQKNAVHARKRLCLLSFAPHFEACIINSWCKKLEEPLEIEFRTQILIVQILLIMSDMYETDYTNWENSLYWVLFSIVPYQNFCNAYALLWQGVGYPAGPITRGWWTDNCEEYDIYGYANNSGDMTMEDTNWTHNSIFIGACNNSRYTDSNGAKRASDTLTNMVKLKI